ncbi:hypothetical protein ABVK25_011956 [Lepraria finkii]|uniref:NAD(P)-binding domain-containing protein n=1 Tax=Lepraria finkii TaxID=1340010 RepID=A0ABR4AMG2_9LECA
MDNDGKTPTCSPSSASWSSKLRLPLSCDPPGPQNPPKQRVWVVFGATGHIGRSIVKSALAHNDLVTAVGRTFEDNPANMSSVYAHPSSSSPLPFGPANHPTSPSSATSVSGETVDTVF